MLRTALLAPAKINLFLDVLARRPDGFHEVRTLLLPLDWTDRVELRVDPGPRAVCCRCPGHPRLGGEGNLAARAAQAFLSLAGVQARVTLRIRKQIWVGAGLGGGSSDAAATLLGLQRLLPGLPSEALRGLAETLGADVPFFLDPRPALASGKGEVVTPLQGHVPILELVLAMSGAPLSTAAVYRAFDEEASAGSGTIPAPCRGIARSSEAERSLSVRSLSEAAALVRNDLCGAAIRLRPEIATTLGLLRGYGALAAGLSGSGAAVFGLFSDGQQSRQVSRALRALGYPCRACRVRVLL